MSAGTSPDGRVREYVCDKCGSTVVGIAALRHLIGTAQANAIWSGEPADGAGIHACVCAFCFSPMSTRQTDRGSAAVCRSCQVVWLDVEAMARFEGSAPDRPQRQMGVIRCDHCGAAVPSPLDVKCRYCGAAFVLATTVMDGRRARRRTHTDLGDVGVVVYYLGRALAAIAGWSPWN